MPRRLRRPPQGTADGVDHPLPEVPHPPRDPCPRRRRFPGRTDLPQGRRKSKERTCPPVRGLYCKDRQAEHHERRLPDRGPRPEGEGEGVRVHPERQRVPPDVCHRGLHRGLPDAVPDDNLHSPVRRRGPGGRRRRDPRAPRHPGPVPEEGPGPAPGGDCGQRRIP